MKVFHIITLLELGGAQQNTLFTVAHLNRERFEVGLMAGEGALLDEEAKKIPNLLLYFLPNLIRSVNPIRDIIALVQMVRILKKEKPFIVHTHSSKAGILGRIAARLAGVPFIIHSIHGFGFNPYQNFFARKLFITLEKWMAHFTHCLIAVTKENIEEGLRLGIGKKEQYTLIRSGVNISKIQEKARKTDSASLRKILGIPEGAKVILTVGPFKIQKNPVAFVQLAKRVLQNIPEAQFLMAGDGELRENVMQEIMANGLEKNVKLLGWRKDIPQLLAASDLFVLTSLWEGLPRAAVEALIVGKPVVAFAVDGLKELIQNGGNGYLIPPNDITTLSQKVIDILKDTKLAQDLGAHALKSIDSSFYIHTMVHQQEELYLNLTI